MRAFASAHPFALRPTLACVKAPAHQVGSSRLREHGPRGEPHPTSTARPVRAASLEQGTCLVHGALGTLAMVPCAHAPAHLFPCWYPKRQPSPEAPVREALRMTSGHLQGAARPSLGPHGQSRASSVDLPFVHTVETRRCVGLHPPSAAAMRVSARDPIRQRR